MLVTHCAVYESLLIMVSFHSDHLCNCGSIPLATLQATLFYENLLVLFTFCCPPKELRRRGRSSSLISADALVQRQPEQSQWASRLGFTLCDDGGWRLKLDGPKCFRRKTQALITLHVSGLQARWHKVCVGSGLCKSSQAGSYPQPNHLPFSYCLIIYSCL
jgi:hypothetical protein